MTTGGEVVGAESSGFPRFRLGLSAAAVPLSFLYTVTAARSEAPGGSSVGTEAASSGAVGFSSAQVTPWRKRARHGRLLQFT